MTNCGEPKYICTKCGLCCRGFGPSKGVILFLDDIPRISRTLEISEEQFISDYCEEEEVVTDLKILTVFTLRHNYGDCIFLTKNNLCSIYEARPVQCQRAPFGFFWNGTLDYEYDCVKDVIVPNGWTSDAMDMELLEDLI